MFRKCTYTWEIKDFMNLDTPPGSSLLSPVFCIDSECKWKLELYPRGYNHDNRNYLSVLILLLPPFAYSHISAMYEFTLLDTNDRITHKFESGHWEYMRGLRKRLGVLNFIRRTTLQSLDLPKGSLKLICNVIYLITDSESSKMLTNISPYRNDESAKMLTNTSSSDVMFQIGRNKCTASKAILAARSPTFYQTLQIDRAGTIVIVDVTTDIFEKILCFIYTGIVKNLHLHAKDLMVAAENYKVYNLRDMCVNYLVGELTVDNAIDAVRFAQKCHCQALEDKVLRFIDEKFVKENPRYLVQQLTNVLKHSRLH